ncbi:predicted protein [Botrytis cinerea T4]|uniref:Uncharacterized protein n=1 Tax=Botryotinia fuckeliana (strain T4) TaxID=999810 RepID=G2YJX0_BOTF4|nr:predicted protein [Botrytis cinerea T4]
MAKSRFEDAFPITQQWRMIFKSRWPLSWNCHQPTCQSNQVGEAVVEEG